MADLINPGMGRDVTVTFTKADGTPGAIQGEPTVDLSDPAMATITMNPFDAASGTFLFSIEHNGSVMAGLMATVSADGDLGEGVHPISAMAEFDMGAPLGATAAAMTVGAERPSAPAVPTP